MEIRGEFGTVLMATFTESIQSTGFGYSQSGNLLMKMNTVYQSQLNAQLLSEETAYHSCPSNVGYGTSEQYFIQWEKLQLLPSISGSGTDSYGSFTVQAIADTDVSETRGEAIVTYKRTYENGHVVYFQERFPYPLTVGLMEVESNWSHDKTIEGWASSGFSRLMISRTPRNSPQNAFLVKPAPAEGIFAFSDSKLDFYMWNYSNCPYFSGTGLSQLGSFVIENSTPTAFTMTYATCKCHVQYTLKESGLVSIFEVVVNCVNNDGTVGDIVDKKGHLIIRGGVAAGRARAANQVSPTWLRATFTRKSELDGSQVVRQVKSENFVLYPKISGSGTDENGDFQLVAFTVTSLKGSNCFFQIYNDGKVIQYDVNLRYIAQDTFEASGTYVTGSGRSGTVKIIMNFGIEASNLDDMTKLSKLTMTFGSGVDHLGIKILPQISGSGIDAFSSYQISGASFQVSKQGVTTVGFTKVYSDETKMTISGNIQYPVPDNQKFEWQYQLEGQSKEEVKKVFGFTSLQGSFSNVISKPNANEIVKENQVVDFSSSGATYKVSLFPFFRGTGEDKDGQFQITPEGQSIIKGDELIIRGRKSYITGAKKGQKMSFSSTLEFPPRSMAGEWETRNLRTGEIKTEFLALFKETKASKLSKETESFTSVYLGCDQYLKLHSTDTIKLPTVSGTGTSDFGDYQVTGTYDIVSGGGTYELTYEWGKCTLKTEPSTESNSEMVGVADLSCSGKVPSGFCDFSETGSVSTTVTESIGDKADADKIIVGKEQAVFVMKRDDGKTSTAKGVLQHFPKLEGHGSDDYKGKFTITANDKTSLNDENKAVIEYDSGVTMDLKYNLELKPDGKFAMKGTFTEQPSNKSGKFTTDGEFINIKPLEGWCPVYGSDKPEPWLTSWPRRDGCDYPDVGCPASVQILDCWIKPNPKSVRSSGSQKNDPYYGFALLVTVPEEYWTTQGWTVALRFPPGQRKGQFTVSNAQFLNVYQKPTELDLLLTSRWTLSNDKMDPYSFVVYADHLSTPDRPSILFWPKRERRAQCFESSLMARSLGGTNDFDRAISRSRLDSASDVKTIKLKNDKIKNVFS